MTAYGTCGLVVVIFCSHIILGSCSSRNAIAGQTGSGPKTESNVREKGESKGDFSGNLQGVYLQAKPDTSEIDFMMGPSHVFYRVSEQMKLSFMGNRYCDSSVVVTTGARMPPPGRRNTYISCGVFRATEDSLFFQGDQVDSQKRTWKYPYTLAGKTLRIKPVKPGFLENTDTYQEHIYTKQD